MLCYIRADANATLASGHIMRCIAIAECLKERGHRVTFLVADSDSTELLANAKMPYIILDSSWDNLDLEVDKMKEILQEDTCPILLIDSYYITRNYVEQLLPYARIFYLGSKREYLGNICGIINYSCDIDYDFYTSYDSEKTKLLLGPQYAPLRKEFSNIPEHSSKDGCRVLLTTGNSDPGNYVPRILDTVLDFACTLTIDVVIGLFYKCVDELVQRYEGYPNVIFHTHVSDMSELMARSDLAISANGTTVYELIASHVSVISFSLVEEQLNSAKALQRMGIVDYAGEIYDNTEACIDKIGEKVMFYSMHSDERRQLSKKAARFIDGNGCARIAEQLELFKSK